MLDYRQQVRRVIQFGLSYKLLITGEFIEKVIYRQLIVCGVQHSLAQDSQVVVQILRGGVHQRPHLYKTGTGGVYWIDAARSIWIMRNPRLENLDSSKRANPAFPLWVLATGCLLLTLIALFMPRTKAPPSRPAA